MKPLRQKFIPDILPGGIFIFLILMGSMVYAAENTGNWRPTYDLVMRWVNFIILVVILVKVGKTPLKNMLARQKTSLESEIKQLEKKKQKAEERANSAQKMLAESHIRFNELKERIEMKGERKRQALIQDAERESKVILDSAKRKLKSQIIKAREDLRGELIDAAVASAFERLPKVIGVEDHQRFCKKYIESLKV
jgi:F-type H+-transporting ATPase subunit b